MLKKVKFTESGRTIVKVYDASEHHISSSSIDSDAFRAVKKMKSLGAEAYIVGGAIRDMVLGKKPKDFDIATSLRPSEIRKHFKNARIIGKRFKLVLLMYSADKAIEVSTFRSSDSGNYENQCFGSVESDAMRRDFSVNALYLDPIELKLYDFGDCFEDLKAHRLVSVIPLERTFAEDPIRMLRAVKYSVKDDLTMDKKLKNQIRSDASKLSCVSLSRMAEEVSKIFLSGMSAETFSALMDFGLLEHILPILNRDTLSATLENLRILDKKVSSSTAVKKEDILSFGIYCTLKAVCDYSDMEIDTKKSLYTRDGKKELEGSLNRIKGDFNDLNFSNQIYYDALKMLIKK